MLIADVFRDAGRWAGSEFVVLYPDGADRDFVDGVVSPSNSSWTLTVSGQTPHRDGVGRFRRFFADFFKVALLMRQIGSILRKSSSPSRTANSLSASQGVRSECEWHWEQLSPT
jgi:hypothetical protein